jgi:hypothetical protein
MDFAFFLISLCGEMNFEPLASLTACNKGLEEQLAKVSFVKS